MAVIKTDIQPPSVGDERPLTLGEFAITMAKRRRAIAIRLLFVAIVATIILFIIPPRFTARVALVPESKAGTSIGQLAGLAALAGLNPPAGTVGGLSQTPQFYAALLTSRPILYGVLGRRYATAGLSRPLVDQDSASLTDIMDSAGDTPAMRLWNGARRLTGWVEVRTDVRTGVVTLTVNHQSPTLAAAVADAFVEELERFNREARQSQAGSRRRFAEERLVVVSADLDSAETALRTFLTRNRSYETSPTLRFEYQRLERALLVQQELYLQIRRELDAARIAEADDMPVFTVVEPPIVPQRRSGPARRMWLVITVLFAAALLSGWYILVDHHARLAPGLLDALEVGAPRLVRYLRAGASRSA